MVLIRHQYKSLELCNIDFSGRKPLGSSNQKTSQRSIW